VGDDVVELLRDAVALLQLALRDRTQIVVAAYESGLVSASGRRD